MQDDKDQDFKPTGGAGEQQPVPPDAAMADFDNPSMTHTSQDRHMDEAAMDSGSPAKTIDESEPAHSVLKFEDLKGREEENS